MSKKRQTKKRPYAHHVPQKKRTMSLREKVLVIAIIAIAAIAGVLLAVVLFYTPESDDDNNDALLSPALHVRTWDAILTQPETAYLVYLYKDDCDSCARLESLIADYALSNEHDVAIYFVNLDEQAFKQTTPPPWSYDATRVDRPLPPSILTIEDGEVVQNVVGESPIMTYLGHYEPPKND